jgi:probable addiction module antidote protein
MENTTTIIPFDPADLLSESRTQLALLKDAAASGNAHYLATAIGAVIRARGGLSQLERSTRIKRQTLHKAFGDSGNPTLTTLLAVLPQLGLNLDFTEREPEEQEAAHA